MVLAIAQTLPCSAILVLKPILARQSRDICWAAIVLAADCIISSRAKERFLIVASFALTPSQGSRDLPKGMNLNHDCLLVIPI